VALKLRLEAIIVEVKGRLEPQADEVENLVRDTRPVLIRAGN
jgi:hypothetical protein